VETVLRTGCIKTICHPFQVAAGILAVFIAFMRFRYLARYRSKLPPERRLVHRQKRVRSLDSTVTAKHTAEEEKRIKEAADRAGLTVSEWSRQTHLDALDVPPWGRVLLNEVMALRKVVIALHLDVCHALSPTEQRLRAIVENAENTKQAMAEKRLHELRNGGGKDNANE
jgi:hypothetical protein